MDTKTAKILEKCTHIAKQRSAAKKLLESELEPVPVELSTATVPLLPKGRGHTSDQIAQFQKLKIAQQEQLGFFESFPITKFNTCPTLFSRIPIFSAMEDEKQEEMSTLDRGWEFDTPWGTGSRHGAILSMWDKHAFLAICRIREKRLKGQCSSLPIAINSLAVPNDQGVTEVDILVCTLTQILEEMEMECDTWHYKRLKKALDRLSRAVIELTTTNPRYTLGMTKGKRGWNFKLLESQWIVNEVDNSGVYYIQLSPVTTRWLRDEFTYIDWEVRKQLIDSPVAAALFDFLSTQPKTFEWNMLAVGKAIGLNTENPKTVRQSLKRGCEVLSKIKWVEGFDFVGTGRKIPLKLVSWR